MNNRLAENLLQLSEARSSVDACQAFSACVCSALGLSPRDVVVFVRDLSDTRQLLCHGVDCKCDANGCPETQTPSTACRYLPVGGVLRCAVTDEEEFSVQARDVPDSDPLQKFLPLSQASTGGVVRCCAIRGRNNAEQVVAVYSAVLPAQPPPDMLAVLASVNGIFAVTIERLGAAREEAETKQRFKLVSKLIACQGSSMQLAAKICSIASEMTGATGSAFLSVNDTDDQLVCQLVNSRPLEVELVFPVTNGPYTHAVLSGSVHILTNCSMFGDELRELVGYLPSSVLCAPIVDRAAQERGEKAVVAVLAVFHRDGPVFSNKDIYSLQWLVTNSCDLYFQSVVKDAESLGQLLNQTLLQVAESLFTHVGDLAMLLKHIIVLAKDLTCAERCSVFLLETNNLTGEEELVAYIFDSDVSTNELRLSVSKGIAGLVARTGELKNIPDAYKCPDFNQEVDQKSGFHTKNILCFPIYGQTGILGVAQLCNKTGGAHHFTHVDEELARAFAVYCGISICQSMVYRRAIEAQNRSQLATELLIYHMQVPSEDVESHCRMVTWKPADIGKDFTSFRFMDTPFTSGETIRMLVTMFDDMGLISRWQIPKENLCRFLLMVQKGYREPPYHNWRHAVSVAQFCYCLWKRCGSLRPLTELEVFGLFVASLCHDIDHRGTNNKFQINAHSVLAALYTSGGSVMEHHHFAQTLGILNSDNCNIFCNLPTPDYEEVLDVVKEVILATDLAVHLRKLEKIKEMAAEGVDGTRKDHHTLLLSLIMTSCDLNACTKSWVDAQSYAELIYMEFFTQGDLERALELQPVEMMDRDKACIPEQQIGFINFIARPVYETLVKIYPRTNLVLRRLERNLNNWVDLKKKYWEASASGENVSESTEILSTSVVDELDEMASGSEGRSSPPAPEEESSDKIPVHVEKVDKDEESEEEDEGEGEKLPEPSFETRARRKRSQSVAQSQLENSLSMFASRKSPDLTRASTGCINFTHKVTVLPAARSRHASTTMGVDCIMKVAKLQAARSTTLLEPEFFTVPNSPWVSPKAERSHVQMRVRRVTDVAEPVLLNQVMSLEARKRHEDGSDKHRPSSPQLQMKCDDDHTVLEPAVQRRIAVGEFSPGGVSSPRSMRRRPASACPPERARLRPGDQQRLGHGLPSSPWPKTSDPTGKRYLKKLSVVAERKFSDPTFLHLAQWQKRAVYAQRRFTRDSHLGGQSQSDPDLSTTSSKGKADRHSSEAGENQSEPYAQAHSLVGSDPCLTFKPCPEQAVTA